uniref:UDP-N-acetylglucosamine 2-epimerase n=1 Tax=Candidatus Methanogaster sp. ANME-2c ERB4 TaxID=2759911 RepID=A0A7G9YLE1_9EURY|nr:UDP-N-acetylglucosamine 2-epimerase [Methanosarcinales archaeon ANME-2c ERB4]
MAEMKIVSVVGARPQFIKCAPLSRELRRMCEEIIIHTGQHYDYVMNKVFFDELEIPSPDHHLNIGSGTHGHQTGNMLKRIEDVLIEEKPDLVMVYGDTNTTLSGALAAVKLHITVAHVEAGLRSFDRRMPEEINRILTDHCSDILFCPTENAVKNLRREGVTRGIHLVGDIMVDALNENIEIAEKKSGILNELDLEPKKYYLITIHRAENTDDYERLKNIVDAACEIENLVFPCHPRTEKYLKEFGLWDELVERVKVIQPVGYWDMLMLEKNAKKIVTDSGGIQKEAYILKVPCITLRMSTEWIETVEAGKNMLVDVNKNKIINIIHKFEPGGRYKDIFGKNASGKICEVLDSLKDASVNG